MSENVTQKDAYSIKKIKDKIEKDENQSLVFIISASIFQLNDPHA
jgi:hypothetical protein